jgi:3-methyladenine DNA glycosylase/8-oxoguanine DNA glycosylase
MSATLATTVGRRTSLGPYHGCHGVSLAVAREGSLVLVVAAPAIARTFPVEGPLDLARTLAVLSHGPGDRTFRVAAGRAWYATRTADGPATVALAHAGVELRAEAWGPGGEPALERVPALLGLAAPPTAIPDGPHRLVRELARRAPGVRIPRSGAVLASLIPAILEQKVTGGEAHRAWSGLIRVHGEPAPGPETFGLRLGPTPETLGALPYYAYHPFGVEQRRAELIRRVAARARWFEAVADLPFEAGYARLTAVPGIGPWTAAEVGVQALGDEDAVSVGDFHLKHLVSFALAGEPRGTDERMLELLEPYRGARARVMRLLELSGISAPRYGPRLAGRAIEDR